MNFSSFFSKEFVIDGIEVEDSSVSINMRCENKSSLCPECGAKSERIHSRYIRTLQDLMVFGKTVTIKLVSRKFFCDNLSCTRSIFTERFETFIESYSRRTERLNEALVKIAFSLSSEAASRISKYIFHKLSTDTFIRIIRKERKEISVMLGISKKSVYRYLRRSEPTYSSAKSRGSILDKYIKKIDELFHAGISSKDILVNIRESGYVGCESLFRTYLSKLKWSKVSSNNENKTNSTSLVH